MKKQRRGLNRYNVLQDGWKSKDQIQQTKFSTMGPVCKSALSEDRVLSIDLIDS